MTYEEMKMSFKDENHWALDALETNMPEVTARQWYTSWEEELEEFGLNFITDDVNKEADKWAEEQQEGIVVDVYWASLVEYYHVYLAYNHAEKVLEAI